MRRRMPQRNHGSETDQLAAHDHDLSGAARSRLPARSTQVSPKHGVDGIRYQTEDEIILRWCGPGIETENDQTEKLVGEYDEHTDCEVPGNRC